MNQWLAATPRFHVHFTPTSGSWLNLIEVWFSIIDRQAIRRGEFPSVPDLVAKIRTFITGWNQRKHPVIWTKTPDQILSSINRKRPKTTSTSGVLGRPRLLEGPAAPRPPIARQIRWAIHEVQ